jgi:K+-sensing histidine kinase KdpD
MATDEDLTNKRQANTNASALWTGRLPKFLLGRPARGYAVSVLTVALATALRWSIDVPLGQHHPFTIYFAAVAISAWYGGFKPAMLALVLSYLAGDWFFLDPRYEINWPHSEPEEFVSLMAFLFSGLAIALTSKVMRDALESAREEQRKLQREVLERQRVERQLREAEHQLREHATLLEQRVEERTAHLRETIRSLEGVCYHIAHDLRAPLRAMSGYVAVMQSERGPGPGGPNPEYLQRITEAALRMDLLIKGLLEFGWLGHGDFPLKNLNPKPVLERVLEQFESEITSQEATVTVQGEWPPILGNDRLFEIVLANFLSNALKFVPPGCRATVRIWAQHADGHIRFCVEDRGIGIPKEYVNRAFGIFERLHPREPYAGIGIGLAIARKAAERMAGRLGLESTVNNGSVFWLELPSAPISTRPRSTTKASVELQSIA